MKFGTAIINAGGNNSRMGLDKSFIDIGGKPLIQHVIDNCRREFEKIIVVTNSKEKYVGFNGIKVVEDEFKGVGPISGLHAGLKASTSQYSFLIACDMPFINIGLVKYMKKLANGCDMVLVNTNAGIEPFHAFYSKRLVDKIECNIKEHKLSFFKLLKSANAKLINENTVRKYSNNLEVFTNLNTPEELNDYYKKYNSLCDSLK